MFLQKSNHSKLYRRPQCRTLHRFSVFKLQQEQSTTVELSERRMQALHLPQGGDIVQPTLRHSFKNWAQWVSIHLRCVFTYLYIYEHCKFVQEYKYMPATVDRNTSFPVCVCCRVLLSHIPAHFTPMIPPSCDIMSKSVTWSSEKLINSPLHRSSWVTEKVGKLLLMSPWIFFLKICSKLYVYTWVQVPTDATSIGSPWNWSHKQLWKYLGTKFGSCSKVVMCLDL